MSDVLSPLRPASRRTLLACLALVTLACGEAAPPPPPPPPPQEFDDPFADAPAAGEAAAGEAAAGEAAAGGAAAGEAALAPTVAAPVAEPTLVAGLAAEAAPTAGTAADPGAGAPAGAAAERSAETDPKDSPGVPAATARDPGRPTPVPKASQAGAEKPGAARGAQAPAPKDSPAPADAPAPKDSPAEAPKAPAEPAPTSAPAPADKPAEAPARPAHERFAGTYRYAGGDAGRKGIDDAIEATVAELNALIRGIARKRLGESNPVREQITIAVDGSKVTTTFAAGRTVTGTIDGPAVAWTDDRGKPLKVAFTMVKGRLVQNFTADDGARRNTFTLDESGGKLTLSVTISSERLPNPLRYALTYRRQ